MRKKEMSKQKWWLISDEDVQKIKNALGNALDSVQDDALHTLESGLHTTDCVPDDWKESCGNCEWDRPPDDCGLGSEPKLVRESRCSSYRRVK